MGQYQRRNFLINKNFQIRYCIYVCSWLFALSIVYPFIIHEVFNVFFVFATKHTPKIPITDLQSIRSDLIWMLISLQAVFLIVTFLISIFISHRIAGPLHKLRMWLQAGREGHVRGDLYFRQADYFREIATDYNLMVSGVYSLIDRNVARLEEVLKASDSKTKNELTDIISDLKNIRENPLPSSSQEDQQDQSAAHS